MQVVLEADEALPLFTQIAEALRAAHTLKGVSGSIGATALREVAEELENTLKEDEEGSFETQCVQAEMELARVVGLIESLQAQPAASSGQSGALPADFDEQLKALLAPGYSLFHTPPEAMPARRSVLPRFS